MEASRPPATLDPPSSSEKPSGPPISDGETVAVSLNLYAIDYSLDEDDTVPTRNDYVALETATADFFEKFMKDAYAASTQATLVSFETLLVTSIFR
jgi:hypothetical protein